jgi:ketosteroid isomerase-like protein
MRKTGILILTAITAVAFAGCGQPATNTNTNTNTNTTKTAAAPTASELVKLDKDANEAYFKGDSKFFETFLSDKFVMQMNDGTRSDKAEAVKGIAGVKCDVKRDWKLEDEQMAKIDADTYVLSYKGTFDGTCTENGKTEKMDSPIRAATVYVRSGDKWQAAFHGENLIVDPNAAPAANSNTASNSNTSSTSNTSSNTNKSTTNTNTASNSNTTANSNASANSNTAASTPPAKSANTDAITKGMTAGWEAWKAKDAKVLTDTSTADLSFVDPIGGWHAGRDAVVKDWTTMDCTGITKVSVKNGYASALSPTVEIWTGTGTADGTCNGQKNGDLHQTAFWVKEGDAWKLAFMFEQLPPAKK